MKKNILIAALLLFSVITIKAQETMITYDELPSEAKSYIEKNFSGEKTLHIKKDIDGMETDYDVHLASGIELEFRGGSIREIDGKMNKLPDAVVPQKIRDYVSKNYSGSFIAKWEQDNFKQEVEISNGMELKFDMDGNFLKAEY